MRPPGISPGVVQRRALYCVRELTGADGGAIWLADATTGNARRLTRHQAFYLDVAFTPKVTPHMALRSARTIDDNTIQEPMWTGRAGGFLRQAELIELKLDDGAVRVVTSGLMGGAPQFTRDRSVVHLNTEGGLEVVRRDGSDRSVAVRLVGLAYYFLEGSAPASDIKVSPDGRHALVIHAQQLYLVTLPDAGGADAKPIDLHCPTSECGADHGRCRFLGVE
jgi:hypothetical protein